MSELQSSLGIRPGNMIWVELGNYYRELGAELCMYAIEAAREAHKKSWNYLRGILKQIKKRGFKTRREAEDYGKILVNALGDDIGLSLRG